MSGKYDAIVIGGSAGSFEAICTILKKLPEKFSLPLFVVLHLDQNPDSSLAHYLNKITKVDVIEANDKEEIQPGTVYIAPPNYHMLVEENRTISLSSDLKVCFSRPSIDVLFESAADVYGEKLIAVILSGANSDGTKGFKKIKERGGMTIVQNPATAAFDYMPNSARDNNRIDHILSLEEIGTFLVGNSQSSYMACDNRDVNQYLY
ncbi:MAG: Chemotaxis response regulator protein-glutamate methylesterase [Chlamydiae bacterium]|nr:Chemotaxis response regulator protein-glutamate methylesterase [Chlamydiota bacterium]